MRCCLEVSDMQYTVRQMSDLEGVAPYYPFTKVCVLDSVFTLAQLLSR
jgi:hypothetical protein